MKEATLGSVLNAVSNLGTEREQIEYLPLSSLESDKGNFYQLSDLDNLANAIALCGLQQPIRVRPHPEQDGVYIILSGHRRTAALWKLVKEGREEFREAKCIVERCTESPELTQLKLIFANSATRELTSAEKAEQIKQTEELLYKLKEQGMEFPGRMRDHVAEVCRTSKSKIARLKVIDEKLIPEWHDAWQRGKYSESPAYAMAKLHPDLQRAIYIAQIERPGRMPAYITEDFAQKLAEAMVTAGKQCKSQTCPDGRKCEHANRRMNAAAKLDRWSSIPCRGCCLECAHLVTCKFNCSESKKAQAEMKDTAKQAEAEAAARAAERDKPAIDFIRTSYERCGQRMRELGLTVDAVAEVSKSYKIGNYEAWMNGQELEKVRPGSFMPFGNTFDSAFLTLVKTAELLQCSTDYLLGREETPQPIVQTNTASGWQTGNPPKPMWAVAEIIYEDGMPPIYMVEEFDGCCWTDIDYGEAVRRWIPLPEDGI